jgi:hypothetical protein
MRSMSSVSKIDFCIFCDLQPSLRVAGVCHKLLRRAGAIEMRPSNEKSNVVLKISINY